MGGDRAAAAGGTGTGAVGCNRCAVQSKHAAVIDRAAVLSGRIAADGGVENNQAAVIDDRAAV